MSTYVQMVNDKELAILKKDPASINKLSQPAGKSYSTYYFCSISYFLTGDAWGSKKHPLSAMLFGDEHIDTSTLENGSFGVIRAPSVAKIAAALAKVDLKKLKKDVSEADWDALMEEEVDDAEMLLESEDAAAEVTADVERLAKFYDSASKKKLGVVMYTT